MLVQRESEKQFAILNQLESRFPIPAIRGSYPIKPASAREIHQRSISKRHIHRVKISATMIAFRVKIFLFFSSSFCFSFSWIRWLISESTERNDDDDSRAAEQYKILVFYLFFFFDVIFWCVIDAWERIIIFSFFFFFFNSHSILICHKMDAMMLEKRKNHVENAYRRDQVTYLCGWWRCPIVRKSNWEMMDAWWYIIANKCIYVYKETKNEDLKNEFKKKDNWNRREWLPIFIRLPRTPLTRPVYRNQQKKYLN